MIIWIEQLYQESLQGKQQSTAALGFDGLMAGTAERAGYGLRASQADGLSAAEEKEIELYVAEGYREFLLAHEWGFTKPTATSVLWATTDGTATMSVSGTGNKTVTASADTFFPTMVGHTIVSTNGSYVIDNYSSATAVTVTTSASADDGEAFTITANGAYRLPDDFGGLLTDVYFQAGDGWWLPLAETGVTEVWEQQQITEGTGRPTMCAVEMLATSGATGQRADLLVWRIPDTDYNVKYQYQVLPDKLTGTDFPYGAARHAGTMQYACLAAMERSKFQLIDGPYQRQYDRLLRMSIRADNRGARAHSLGLLISAQPHGRFRGRRSYPLANRVSVGGEFFP